MDYKHLLPSHDIILLIQNIRSIKEVKRMAHEPRKTIKVAPDSELGRLVDEARRHPVLLEKDGAVYSINPHSSDPDDLWTGYDPKKVWEAISAYGGSWNGVDAEAMITAVYEARTRGSRPAHHP
jgi:hypothetical protein